MEQIKKSPLVFEENYWAIKDSRRASYIEYEAAFKSFTRCFSFGQKLSFQEAVEKYHQVKCIAKIGLTLILGHVLSRKCTKKMIKATSYLAAGIFSDSLVDEIEKIGNFILTPYVYQKIKCDMGYKPNVKCNSNVEFIAKHMNFNNETIARIPHQFLTEIFDFRGFGSIDEKLDREIMLYIKGLGFLMPTEESGNGFCDGISLTAAKKIKMEPDVDINSLYTFITSSEGVSASRLAQKYLGVAFTPQGNSLLLDHIAEGIWNTDRIALASKVLGIPKNEIQVFCPGGYFISEAGDATDILSLATVFNGGGYFISPAVDATNIFSLASVFNGKSIVLRFFFEKEIVGHSVMLYSSDEKNKHIYIDSNCGLFSFESKRDLSLFVSANIDHKNHLKSFVII